MSLCTTATAENLARTRGFGANRADNAKSRNSAVSKSVIAAGAVIAEYQPTMYHCKVTIVDGMMVSVGSTHFDNRSFRLNDDATLAVVDKAFAGLQTATFEADVARSHPVSYSEWLARPIAERLMESLASLLGTQL